MKEKMEEAVKIREPLSAEFLNKRGCKYFKNGYWDKAIEAFTQAAAFIDSNVAKYLTNRGTVYYFKKEYDLALSDFTFAIEADHNYALAFIKRGNIFMEKYEHDRELGQGQPCDLQSAISDFTETIRLNPKEPEVLANRAAAYGWLNDNERAFADICSVIEIENPPNAVNFVNRGVIHAAWGYWDRAFDDFKTAMKLFSLYGHEPSEKEESVSIIKKLYYQRFEKTLVDDFYILLISLVSSYGKYIFEKDIFLPLLLDHANGEFKKDIRFLCYLFEQNIHREIKETRNVEKTKQLAIENLSASTFFREDNPSRFVDILCCLLRPEDYFLQEE